MQIGLKITWDDNGIKQCKTIPCEARSSVVLSPPFWHSRQQQQACKTGQLFANPCSAQGCHLHPCSSFAHDLPVSPLAPYGPLLEGPNWPEDFPVKTRTSSRFAFDP